MGRTSMLFERLSIRFFFFFFLAVSITALSTQMEVKWPLKQLSITPQAPSRIGCCCQCVPPRGLFYSIHRSLHTYCIMFALLHTIYCTAATLAQHSVALSWNTGHSECAGAKRNVKPLRVSVCARD